MADSSAEVLPVKLAEISKDEKIAAVIEPYRLELDKSMSEVLCESSMNMSKSRPESALGNLVADLCLDLARKKYKGTIDACMMNTGGLRSSLSKGPIDIGSAYELMPFDNELVVVSIPANEVDSMFHYLASEGGDPVSDISLGIKDAKPVHPLIGGAELDENRTYHILTSDYLATGGDDMTFFTNDHRTDIHIIGLKVRDAIIMHFREVGESGKTLSASKDNRIHHE